MVMSGLRGLPAAQLSGLNGHSLLLGSSSDQSEQPAVRRGVQSSRHSSPLSLSRNHSPAPGLPFYVSCLMKIVGPSPMLLKGNGMNGVNLEATGGLRVMNDAMSRGRSIAPAEVHGDGVAHGSTTPNDRGRTRNAAAPAVIRRPLATGRLASCGSDQGVPGPATAGQ